MIMERNRPRQRACHAGMGASSGEEVPPPSPAMREAYEPARSVTPREPVVGPAMAATAFGSGLTSAAAWPPPDPAFPRRSLLATVFVIGHMGTPVRVSLGD
jgi:hypothetical protein